MGSDHSKILDDIDPPLINVEEVKAHPLTASLKAMKNILVGLGQAAAKERVRNNINDVDRERVNKFRRDTAAFSSSLINKYRKQKKVLELLSQGLVTDESAGATLATIAKADTISLIAECQRLIDECGQVETILQKALHQGAQVGIRRASSWSRTDRRSRHAVFLNSARHGDRPCHCWLTWRGNRHRCCCGTLNFPQVREAGIHRDVRAA
jgi:hypothetical protein